MLIYVDIDGTIADLNSEWFRRYNNDTGDNLTVEKVTDWDVSKFVIPSVGNKIYRYLELPDLYDGVLPIPGALQGIRMIREAGNRVIFASAGAYGATSKFHWLKRWGFDPGLAAENFISIYDKSLLKGDMLIDDRDKNILDFGDMRSILIDAPYNQNFYWHNRAKNWADVVSFVSSLGYLEVTQ